MEILKTKMTKDELDNLIFDHKFAQFQDDRGIYGGCLFGGMTRIGKDVPIDYRTFYKGDMRSPLKEIIECDKKIKKGYF